MSTKMPLNFWKLSCMMLVFEKQKWYVEYLYTVLCANELKQLCCNYVVGPVTIYIITIFNFTFVKLLLS